MSVVSFSALRTSAPHAARSTARRAALLLVLLTAACGGGDGSGATGPGGGGAGPGAATPPPLTVTVQAAAGTVPAAGTVTLTAALSGGAAGAAAAGVTWRTSRGTISANGTGATLTAPVQSGAVTVTALAVADTTRRATATVTVTPVAVAIDTPATTSVPRGQSLGAPLRATVTGAAPGRDSVTWSASCGTLDPRDASATDWLAPTAPGTCTVTATSTLDPAATASLDLAVRDAWLVTTLEDDGDDAAECTVVRCTLRAAFGRAGSTAAPDTIVLGDAAIGRALTGTIRLVAPLPIIESPIRLEGPGADVLTIDADATTATPRVIFDVRDEGVFTAQGLTLRGGEASRNGGAIDVGAFGKLVLRDVVLRDNRAPSGSGGALHVGNRGEAVLERVEIVGNSAWWGGGIDVQTDGVLVMSGGRIAENVADGFGSSAGGGMRTFGSHITLTGVVVEGNRARRSGGMELSASPGVPRTLVLDSVTVRDNVATNSTGGLRINGGSGARLSALVVTGNRALSTGGLSIENALDFLLFDTRIAEHRDSVGGPGGVLIDDASGTLRDIVVEDNDVGTTSGIGGVRIGGGATVTLERVAIRRNRAGGTGGLLVTMGGTTVIMRGGEVRDNEAVTGGGGGIVVDGNATLTLDDVTVADNRAATTGGGIFRGPGSLAITRSRITGNRTGTNGGALFVGGSTPMTIDGTTFAANEAGSNGGGIYAIGPVTVRNGTFAANRASSGSAIAAFDDVTLTNVTVADQRGLPNTNASALLAGLGHTLTVTNVLLARNRSGRDVARNCVESGGTLASGGHNLSDDASCTTFTATGDRRDVPAALADSLTDNGGPTPTYLPLAGSPAVNGGLAAACPPTDQRGAPRVGTCDIGATEFGSSPPAGATRR